MSTEQAIDLPTAWRAAIAFCPYCQGSGTDCLRCQQTGDLMGVMLLDAYRRGRGDVLAGLRTVEEVRRAAVGRLTDAEPTTVELKRKMGLPS